MKNNNIKLKKNRRASYFEIIFICLLLVVILFFLSMYVLSHQDYTIYKTECRNEVYRINMYPNGCTEILKIDGGFGVSVTDSCDIYDINTKGYRYVLPANYTDLHKTICEPVEVDEIGGYCMENYDFMCDNYNGWLFIWSINKVKITKEWLDENCECLESYCPESKQLCGWSDKSDFYKHCAKWKCGDYKVILNDKGG